MVREEDAEFHDRDPKDYDWAETRFISFSVPEEQLFGKQRVDRLGELLAEIVGHRGATVGHRRRLQSQDRWFESHFR